MVTNTAVSHSPQYDDSEFEYAGFWIRFAACIVDNLIIMIISAPFVFIINQQMMAMSVDEIPFYIARDAILHLAALAAVIWFWVKKAQHQVKCSLGCKSVMPKRGNLSVCQGHYCDILVI